MIRDAGQKDHPAAQERPARNDLIQGRRRTIEGPLRGVVQEAAMRLRAHRRNLVVWSTSAGPAGRYSALGLTQLTRARRIRRHIRIGVLLTVIGVVNLARVARPRWPLLAGVVLTVAGVMLRGSAWGAVLLPGLMFLLSAPLIPASPAADRRRRSQLERELAAYTTPAQRCDLEATLDRYPDSVTDELRDILASQAMAADDKGIPGTRGFRDGRTASR